MGYLLTDFSLWNDNFMRFYTKSVSGCHIFSRFRGTVICSVGAIFCHL